MTIENNNPLIEQFRNEITSQQNLLSKESWDSIPLIAFRVAATAGWTYIGAQISNIDGVLHKESGLQLCQFAISVMASDVDSNIRISEATLDFGIECLKSLLSINKDSDHTLSFEQKEQEKEIGKVFFDFWKEWLKSELKREGRFI